jgi:DNA-binding transcriptional LysR family regulator
MNFEYLRNFVKLIEYKSFSNLAKELPISQSTLSHQIAQLEKDFGGVLLINRTTKKFELTEAGECLLSYAEKILRLYDNCRQEISQFSDRIVENIVISASTIPGSHILPRYIAEFSNNNSNVNFKIIINNSQKSIELIKKGMVDFAGIGSFMNYKQKDFECIKLGEDEFRFICSPNHELIKKGITIEIDDLLKFPFVWREKGSGTRNTFEQQFSRYKELNIELEINDNDSIISTVSDSNYISIMSGLMANKAEKAGLIKSLKISNLPVIAKRNLYLIKLRNKEVGPLKKKFWIELNEKLKN